MPFLFYFASLLGFTCFAEKLEIQMKQFIKLGLGQSITPKWVLRTMQFI